MKIVARLKPYGLVEEVQWDPDRQMAWRSKFDKAKSDIEKVNVDIQHGIDERVASVKGIMVGRSRKELDQAIQAAAYAGTRDEVIAHLRGQLQGGKVGIWNGAVEFYSAYQSQTDFNELHPDENAVKHGVEHINFLIQYQLAVPDEPPEKLLDGVIKLSMDSKFRERRRLLYDYQIDMLKHGHKPKKILNELNKLVTEYNAHALADNQKCRWETAVIVLSVVGAAMTAWAGFNPTAPAAGYAGLFGAVTSVGPAVWTKLQPSTAIDGIPRIAAGEAMFHQIDASTGFQYRAIAQR
jgi:hypothetical protein